LGGDTLDSDEDATISTSLLRRTRSRRTSVHTLSLKYRNKSFVLLRDLEQQSLGLSAGEISADYSHSLKVWDISNVLIAVYICVSTFCLFALSVGQQERRLALTNNITPFITEGFLPEQVEEATKVQFSHVPVETVVKTVAAWGPLLNSKHTHKCHRLSVHLLSLTVCLFSLLETFACRCCCVIAG